MNMKRIILTAVTAPAVSARASRYTIGSIPAGNPTGATFTGTHDQIPTRLTEFTCNRSGI
jgi:hypothetical protein